MYKQPTEKRMHKNLLVNLFSSHQSRKKIKFEIIFYVAVIADETFSKNYELNGQEQMKMSVHILRVIFNINFFSLSISH